MIKCRSKLDAEELVEQLRYRDAILEVKKYITRDPTKLNQEIEDDESQHIGTLLHFSCLWNRPKVVSYLLSQNADVTKCFFDGINDVNPTALQIAEKRNYEEIVALFKTASNITPTFVPVSSTKTPVHQQQHSSTQSDTPKKTEQPPQKQKLSGQCTFSVKASGIIEKHLTDITTKKNDKTRKASFDYLEGELEDQAELKDDLNLLLEIKSNLNFNQFDINSYLAVFNAYLPQTTAPMQVPNSSAPSREPQNQIIPSSTTRVQERGNRREPPTARDAPGKRFLQIVPNASTNPNDVKDGLNKHAIDHHLSLEVLLKFEEKIKEFTRICTPERAFAKALCWIYTTDSWVYSEVNAKLRDDCSTMFSLAPYMKALIESYKSLKGDDTNFYSGIVYRRTRLTPKGFAFYKPDLNFVWSSFTSTAIDFNPDGTFGDILFVVTIPETFKEYALCLEKLSEFPTEREVLLLPNNGYRVVSIEPGPRWYPNTTHVISLIVEYVCIT